jgi:peptidoglycan/LPS O-acetylase OafA/YrhL
MAVTMSAPMPSKERPSERSFFIDVFKAIGCTLIVLHHLAFYGPMADVVAKAWPGTISWLAQHARLAVYMFLVCSGFLTAQTVLTLPSLSLGQVLQRTAQRYLRLVGPLLAALSLTVLISELIRDSFAHESLSATPGWAQVLGHVFFLQHLLGQEALSAGVWYVAVDFQLYLSALLLTWGAQRLQAYGQGMARAWQTVLVAVLMLGSLVMWSHQQVLEDTALFFWGAYGLGVMAWRTRAWPVVWQRTLVWLLLAGLCLLWDERGRALTAWAVAAWLAWMPMRAAPQVRTSWQEGVVWLSRISYSVFVVHFGVSLGVNALVSALWPDVVLMNAAGMVAALALSLLLGQGLHRLTEQGRARWTRWAGWSATFMVSSAAAMWLAS